jgi:hypothetical protein
MMKHQGAHANNFQMWSTVFKHYEIIRVFPHFQTILSNFLLHAPLPTFRIASSSWHPESLSRRRPRRTLLFRMDIKQKRRFNPRTCFFYQRDLGFWSTFICGIWAPVWRTIGATILSKDFWVLTQHTWTWKTNDEFNLPETWAWQCQGFKQDISRISNEHKLSPTLRMPWTRARGL